MMLIIVEGPDGSGKTTLINTLCERGYGKKIFGICKDVPNQMMLWYELITSCVDDKSNVYIMDRCYLSDWAYRLAMNDGEACMSLTNISDLLSVKNVIYIFCKNKNAYELAKLRGEDYVQTKEQHVKVCNSYDFIYDTISKFCKECICLKYDFESNLFRDVTDKLRYVL
jgi:thymidylate kinase